MTTPNPNPTKAAKPSRNIFDPWNSSSTGHQRDANRMSGSTSWRDSRSAKLAEQFRDGQRGGMRMYNTIGRGSKDFGVDGRLENGDWERGAKGLRKDGQTSLWEAYDGGAKSKKPGLVHEGGKDSQRPSASREEETREHNVEDGLPAEIQVDIDTESGRTPLLEKQIFRGLTIYINGSTYPLISDHKLKRLLAERGARMSIALGRRSVTHVIIGSPNIRGNGTGGGLAGGKIQKEIANVNGKGIKFVSAEWVLESVKAGKRLSEARFACLKLAPKGQNNVLRLMGSGSGKEAG